MKGFLLYDGHCPFCRAQAGKISRLAGPGIELVSFQEKGALDRFPKLTFEECMRELKLVEPDGRISGGMEAVVRAIHDHALLRFLVWAYYLPAVRQISNGAYRLVARNRYRLNAKECPEGTCGVHQPKK
ncbi:MAG: DUF393 domain-containing protein [Candidatus Omnitrophica bacterium]|nr:DUF393 domain-containing protein [Candidatus Omnitrophota bacterium]